MIENLNHNKQYRCTDHKFSNIDSYN